MYKKIRIVSYIRPYFYLIERHNDLLPQDTVLLYRGISFLVTIQYVSTYFEKNWVMCIMTESVPGKRDFEICVNDNKGFNDKM